MIIRAVNIGGMAFVLMCLMIGCIDYKGGVKDISIKEKPMKLRNLHSKQKQTVTNRIFIEENDDMASYLLVTGDYNGNPLLVREYLLDQPMAYNLAGRDAAYYENSKIDLFLNEDFYNHLAQVARENIVDSTIEITHKDSLGIGGKDVTSINRKVFLLSYTEMNGSSSRTNLKEGVALPYFSDKSSRIAYYSNGEPGSWWLRTPNTADTDVVGGVSNDGVIGVGGINGLDGEYLNGIRPAFCLDGNTHVIPRDDLVMGETVYVLDLAN